MNILLKMMENGNEKQRRAYHAIKRLDILNNYPSFQPVLCGTIPIGIDVENSDLDIIMEAYDLLFLEQCMIQDYGHLEEFRIKRKIVRERDVLKANFFFEGFMFEVFAQPQPVHEQHAYLHMKIEAELMRTIPGLREKVIVLKKKGMKTEAAFCKQLGIEGDPYLGLLEYGKRLKLIE